MQSKEAIEKLRNTPMLFILGKGRSGTSLLQNLIDAHPAMIGPPESKFAVLLYPRFGHIKKWKDSDIINFVETLYIEPLFASLWHLDKKKLTETLLSVRENADYPLLCKMVYYQMSRGKENLQYISDKNPEYILFIHTILKIFPEAKFIHIIREPRDNINSQMHSFNEKNPLFRAYQWLAFNKIVEREKRKSPGRYFTVLYETLVQDTEGTMKKICDFLQIPFSDPMTRNVTPAWLSSHLERRGMSEKGPFMHKSLTEPVNTSNVGKWKRGMDPFARVVTEIVTSKFAKEQYGYDISFTPAENTIKVSPFRLLKGKVLYYTWQTFIRMKFKSLRVNLAYLKLKKAIKGEANIRAWEHF